MLDTNAPAGFKFYAFGTAAENKPAGSHDCEVIPLDISNFLDGEATKHGSKLEIDLMDGRGNIVSEKAVTSTPIPATWLCLGESNRITAPDIRRGEEVIIFTYADTDKFYWTPRNTNRYLRKLETVVLAFSGTTNEGDKEVTDKNHYIFEISTHKKHLVLSTSDANGEVCRWFLQVRGSDGKFIVCDDTGNEILIDNLEKLIRLINANDTEIELNKKDININVPGNYGLDVKGKQTITINGPSDIMLNGGSTVNITGNSSVNVTGSASITAGSYELNSTTIVFNGNVAVNGTFTSLGYASFPSGHGPH